MTLELDPSEFPKAETVILESLKEILAFLRKETGKEDNQVRVYDREFQAVPFVGAQ